MIMRIQSNFNFHEIEYQNFNDMYNEALIKTSTWFIGLLYRFTSH